MYGGTSICPMHPLWITLVPHVYAWFTHVPAWPMEQNGNWSHPESLCFRGIYRALRFPFCLSENWFEDKIWFPCFSSCGYKYIWIVPIEVDVDLLCHHICALCTSPTNPSPDTEWQWKSFIVVNKWSSLIHILSCFASTTLKWRLLPTPTYAGTEDWS